MNEWKEYKLEAVINRFIDYRGKTPNKKTSGIPLLTAKIVKNGNLLYPNEFISEDDYLLWMTRGFPSINDVVMTTEAPLGEVALIKDAKVALGQRLITLQTKKEICNSIFLKYYLQSDEGQYQLQSRASGSTVEGIKSSELKKIEIKLPSVKEQKQIATILSTLDDKIDLLTRQNRTLESMAETLFRQYFIENPKADWNDGVIADIIDFNPIRKLSKDTIAPFLEMSNLSTTTYAPNGWYDRAFSSGTKFKNEDTLLARITPCLENGKTAYVDFLKDEQVAWGSTEYIVMCPKGELHPFFAYIVAKYQDFRDYAESCMSGSSGRQRVDVDNLKGYGIKIPDSGTIKQFNVCVESIVGKMNCNNNQIRSLTKLRDNLLPKLMNNEITIY